MRHLFRPGWLNNFWPFGSGRRTRTKRGRRRYPMSFYLDRRGLLNARVKRRFGGKSPARTMKASDKINRRMRVNYYSALRQDRERQQRNWRKSKGRRLD